jgi:hypothetical protein
MRTNDIWVVDGENSSILEVDKVGEFEGRKNELRVRESASENEEQSCPE